MSGSLPAPRALIPDLSGERLDELIRAALAEDLGPGPDVTSVATVPADQVARMHLVARRAGVVAGVPVAARAFEVAGLPAQDLTGASTTGRHPLPGDLVVAPRTTDGQPVTPGQVLLTVTGPARTLLLAERTALNLICHLSGVATSTAAWAEAISGSRARIRDTRKTTPGLRALEKYAVRCGGGENHRMGLWDAALVKDNHVLAAGGVAAAFDAVRQQFPGLPVEVEVDDLDQLAEVVLAGADLVLLDNFSVEQTERAVALVAGRCRLESSGGLSLDVAEAYAATGVDYLAVGALTHSAPILDIAAELEGALMLLAIDVGNTNTVLGLFDNHRLSHSWRIKTDPRATADEMVLVFRGLLTQAPQITGISMCSTVPAVLREMRAMILRYFAHIPAVIVEPGTRTGVPLIVDNPKEVGADRIVNTLAAFTLFGGPAIVVDFGTSTNLDVVSAKGEFLGGALAPGIEISLDALAARAAALRKVELVRPKNVIGKNTVDALQSGAIYGFAGQVDGLVERIIVELGGRVTAVIATGGLASIVVPESRTITHNEPDLTLVGLDLVYAKNLG